MENKDDIGKRIRDIRLSKRLTQAELGCMLGLSDKSISSYEKGNSDLSTFVAAKIAEIGGRTIDWLITGKEPPSNTPQPTKEDLIRLVFTNETDLTKTIKDEIFHQVREERKAYGELASEEQQLLDAFRCAEGLIREEALGMLVRSAERSKGSGGGEKGLKKSNGE